MIRVKNLTKKYDEVVALDNISFEVKSGEILGFLGPNGAGKTTCMKILTSFMAPTSGKASIDNFDCQENALEVKRKIGYLPENNPLYEEMRVDEYLKFIAEAREIPKDKRKKRTEKIIEVCGLKEVLTKNISALSKGYRQRVGLAQAMVHEPEILILDEPTSGLDPNQIAEIRELIKKIGQEKTVILSTHILPEVQATCSRAIIINQGKIVSQGTLDEIMSRARGQEEMYIKVKGPKDQVQQTLSSLRPAMKIDFVNKEDEDKFGFKLGTPGHEDLREEIFETTVRNNWKLLEMYKVRVSLEDIFRELTTKEK